MAVDFGGLGLLMQNDATLLSQIAIGPDVVVAREIVYLDPHVGEFGELAKEAGVAAGHYIFILIPEVEHVAQQVDGGSLLLDAVKESDQTALLHTLVRDGQ